MEFFPIIKNTEENQYLAALIATITPYKYFFVK